MALVAKGVFTSQVNLSGFGQASDGQMVAGPDERWLVAGNGPDNGYYVTQAGEWDRAPELDEPADFVWGNDNTIIRVRGGNEWGNSEWAYNGIDNPTIGQETLYFAVRHKYYAAETATELTSYIEGLGLYYVDATTVGLSPGRAYVPGLGKVLTVEAPQTWPVPGGANALYFCYLEEYPAGSGLGRLRLITTAPGEPYLGSAATQSDDATARYLGMVRKAGDGNVLSFQQEVLGGSALLHQYTPNHAVEPSLRVLYGNTGTNTAQEVAVGPDAPTAQKRLVSPAARLAHVLVDLSQDPGDMTYLGHNPGAADDLPVRVYPNWGGLGQTYAWVTLTPAQGLKYKPAQASTEIYLYLVAYYERR